MKLMARDYRTIEHVFFSRYLTNKQIAALEYTPGTYSHCKERLAWMVKNKYLRVRTGNVNQSHVYYLGLRGKRHITTLSTWTKEQVDKIAGVPGGLEPPMDHDLQLSSLYVRAVLECRENDWKLVWATSRMLQVMGMETVEPDAYLTVYVEDKTYEAFIEYTKVMPGMKELHRKLVGYQKLYEALGRGIPVLWLADNQKTLQRLSYGIRTYIYRDYIMLTCYDDAHHFLTAYIWRWGKEIAGFIPKEKNEGPETPSP